MHQIASVMKLNKGFEAEYKRRHTEIWPELQALLKSVGISSYYIYLEEATGFLFAIIQVEDAGKLKELPNDPIMKKWWAYMKDIMETNEDNSPVSTPLKEVFCL